MPDDQQSVDTQQVSVGKDYKRFAACLKDGMSVKSSLMAAGYSEAQANKGMATVMRSEPLQKALLDMGMDYAKIGEKIDPRLATNAIRGKLYTNMITGKSEGNEAAKMLGSMKDIGAFTPDSQQGVVAIQVNIGDKEEAKPLPSVTIRELPE